MAPSPRAASSQQRASKYQVVLVAGSVTSSWGGVEEDGSVNTCVCVYDENLVVGVGFVDVSCEIGVEADLQQQEGQSGLQDVCKSPTVHARVLWQPQAAISFSQDAGTMSYGQ